MPAIMASRKLVPGCDWLVGGCSTGIAGFEFKCSLPIGSVAHLQDSRVEKLFGERLELIRMVSFFLYEGNL